MKPESLQKAGTPADLEKETERAKLIAKLEVNLAIASNCSMNRRIRRTARTTFASAPSNVPRLSKR